jgi:glycerate kinase
MGMAQALGFQFLDYRDQPVDELPQEWHQVERIASPRLHLPPIQVACDVDNPLLGPRGATAVYGPQKGVWDVGFFESRLTRLAETVLHDLGVDCAYTPGAGAAGGLGFGLMAFCNATLMPGFDLVANVLGLKEQIRGAALVVTGEGRMDEQSLCGKGPSGVAAMARAAGARVLGVAGSILSPEKLTAHFDLLLAAKPDDMPLEQAMQRGAELIQETVERHGSAIRELVL